MPNYAAVSGYVKQCATFLCCLLAFASASEAQSASPSVQQTAIVTFYAHGTAASGLPGSKHGVFYGLIFDGNIALVGFHEGVLVHNNRFITLRLPVGPHDFVATNSSHPSKEDHIEVTFLPDHKYFLRAQNESSGIGFIEWEKARLDPMTCEDAHKDAPNAKQLHPQNPPAALAAQLVSVEEMPPCQ